jgi:hypothetical protein
MYCDLSDPIEDPYPDDLPSGSVAACLSVSSKPGRGAVEASLVSDDSRWAIRGALLVPGARSPRQPRSRSASQGAKDAVAVCQRALSDACVLIQPLVGVRRPGVHVELERNVGGR